MSAQLFSSTFRSLRGSQSTESGAAAISLPYRSFSGCMIVAERSVQLPTGSAKMNSGWNSSMSFLAAPTNPLKLQQKQLPLISPTERLVVGDEGRAAAAFPHDLRQPAQKRRLASAKKTSYQNYLCRHYFSLPVMADILLRLGKQARPAYLFHSAAASSACVLAIEAPRPVSVERFKSRGLTLTSA